MKTKLYGFFNNSQPIGDSEGLVVDENGNVVTSHISSTEEMSIRDLGMDGTTKCKHDIYDKAYPGGWEYEYVRIRDDRENHPGLKVAVTKYAKKLSEKAVDVMNIQKDNFNVNNINSTAPIVGVSSAPIYADDRNEYGKAIDRLSQQETIKAIDNHIRRLDPKNNAIVCAAVYYDDFNIILGVSHWDAIMEQKYEYLQELHKLKNFHPLPPTSYWKQGFIDKHGKFLNREQAWVVAKNAGQIIKELTGSYTKSGNLYIEHLFS